MKTFIRVLAATVAALILLSVNLSAQAPVESEKDSTAKTTEGERSAAKPELNEKFISDDLKIEEWLARFEIESREVFAARKAIMKAIGVASHHRVADIGAGTGLYTRQFSDAAKDGWVFAVDISPKFLTHIRERADENQVANITTVLCSQSSINLPPNSIDIAFICDTYHHFESPADTLASIHQAMKPGGKLIVIDFERVPGKSREWILNHVRAGKQEFRQEIEAAEFAFVGEVQIDEFEENYFLEFKRR